MMNYNVNYTHTAAEFELLKHDYDSFWGGENSTRHQSPVSFVFTVIQ